MKLYQLFLCRWKVQMYIYWIFGNNSFTLGCVYQQPTTHRTLGAVRRHLNYQVPINTSITAGSTAIVLERVYVCVWHCGGIPWHHLSFQWLWKYCAEYGGWERESVSFLLLDRPRGLCKHSNYSMNTPLYCRICRQKIKWPIIFYARGSEYFLSCIGVLITFVTIEIAVSFPSWQLGLWKLLYLVREEIIVKWCGLWRLLSS